MLIQTIILAIVEAVTEFLPISSTGHLIIVEDLGAQWLGWQKLPFSFDLFIQMGAYLAVVVIFRKKIWGMIRSVFDVRSVKSFSEYANQIKIPLGIVIATIPAGLVGFLFEDWITDNLHKSFFVAFALIIVGAVMWYFDRKAESLEEKHKAESENKSGNEDNYVDSIEELSLREYIVIGLWQVIALFPGASRSGSTITGARSLKIERKTAAEVSFLLGLPLVLGAGLKGFYDLIRQSSQPQVVQVEPAIMVVGFVVAFITAMLVIKFLLKFLQERSLKVFSIYRILLGVGLIGYFLVRG